MKGITEAHARLEAFAECYQWVGSKTEAEMQLRIRMDELKWVLEKTR